MVSNSDFILITGASGFIGTNLIELFEEKGYSFINYDKADVTNPNQHKYWHKGNIMDKKVLSEAFDKYKPSIVIHLAARTDTLSDKLEDYIENTEGTKNVVDEIKKHDYVKHALFASTQYVYKDKVVPFGQTDDSYAPHTVYGISKKMDEEYIRQSGMKCKWTIFRPCNVWGPWHMRYPNELWKFIAKGIYVHPSNKPVIRTYAYVKNLVKQLDAIMNAPDDLSDRKTYYLGDMPIDSYIWLNTLSQETRGKKIRRIPKFFFWGGALIGDFLRLFGIKFPLYSMRYRNMIEDFYAPSNVTIALFGAYEKDYKKNVKETIDWLRGEYGKNFDYWKDYPCGNL
ncbi:MAG: NAD(P)-dependent oxidoreductase [Prevotella sp.]|nr:NAD(P)-dependent oxidoreductase [Prevotella sp.]